MSCLATQSAVLSDVVSEYDATSLLALHLAIVVKRAVNDSPVR